MAKQSARRDRKNQGFPPCFISTLRVMWFRSANSHTGPQHKTLHQEAGQMAASDYVSNPSNYRLRFLGRPQMGSGTTVFSETAYISGHSSDKSEMVYREYPALIALSVPEPWLRARTHVSRAASYRQSMSCRRYLKEITSAADLS